MKYLKYFEEVIKLRSGTELIDREQIGKNLSNLKYFNVSDIPIYRGLKISKNPDECFIIDPKKHIRKSAYTENFYTLIIDNLESWKNYPKRSQSLICSTSRVTARTYGQLYRVIPLNKNSKWGVCNEYDMWFSFPELKKYDIKYLDTFNNRLSTIYWDTFRDDRIGPLSGHVNRQLRDIPKKYFFVELEKMFDKIKKTKSNILKDKNFPTTLKELYNIFEPEKNNFNHFNNYRDTIDFLSTMKNVKYEGLELWTNSKSLLIPIEYYDIIEKNDIIKLIGK